jgi:hypothetical protein
MGLQEVQRAKTQKPFFFGLAEQLVREAKNWHLAKKQGRRAEKAIKWLRTGSESKPI